MSALGLDIGSYSIKAVQLERQGNGFKLLGAGITSTPVNGLSGSPGDSLKTAEAVKKLLGDTKLSPTEVNLALPEPQVFTRLITLPYLSDEETTSAISWQAEQYVPIPLSKANIAHIIVNKEQPKEGNSGKTEVLIVAAPKEVVKKYVDIVNLSGLKVAVAETELLSLSRVFGVPNQTALIADLGAISTDLGIIQNTQLLASRSIATAGHILTKSAATGLSITEAQAEEYKKTYGLRDDQLEGKVKTALEPTFRVIVDEMRKLIQYYKTELKKEEPLSAVIISGGTSGMPEISTYIAQNLGIEVIIGDPFSKIMKDARISDSFKRFAPLYPIAVGLAQNL